MVQPSLYIINICKQVEFHIGYKIKNIADAKKTAEQLAQTKLHISPHTIARLYGVVKPFRTPYKDTLNLLARYVSYNDWEDFCENQTNIPFDPNYFLTEASDGFSLATLHLSLLNEDFDAFQLILGKASNNDNEMTQYAAAELIGSCVRKSKRQNELLEILSNSAIGMLYYYESFVDEDNEADYFSNALFHYYLPKINNDYRKLYAYCFDISQTAHKKQKEAPSIQEFQKLIVHLDKRNCHFHELSRWIECLILIDGFNNVLNSTWQKHVNELLLLLGKANTNEKAWLIARPLKAFLLFDLKVELFNSKELNIVIDELIKNQKKVGYSIALYTIQYFWICKSKYFGCKTIYLPFRIHNILFLNESNEKNAIEFAIASLLATGDNKKICNSNLHILCKEKGIYWVLKLLE